MKKILLFFIAISISAFSFSQLPFLPVGSTWASYYQCDGGGPPPMYNFFTVTEDSVIQGKLCTRLHNADWPCNNNNERTYVYQEDGKVYRYDLSSQEFKLVIDYTKQAGETWVIEVCASYFGADSVTVTVLEVNGNTRLISVKGGFMNVQNLVLYEGFGCAKFDARLIVSEYYVVMPNPFCWSELVCYEDPVNGVLFGSLNSCMTSTDEKPGQKLFVLKIAPNPSSSYANLIYELPPTTTAEIHITNAPGRRLSIHPIKNESGSLTLEGYPVGLYFVSLVVDGKVMRTEKFIRL